MQSIQIEYKAPTTIADPQLLESEVERQIRAHLKSITDVPVRDVDLKLQVTQLEIRAGTGTVAMKIQGAINGLSFDRAVKRSESASSRMGQSGLDRLITRAFANIFTLLVRLFVPSTMTRAIGNRRVSEYAVRACNECLAEVRIEIDTAIGRRQSFGLPQWQTTKSIAWKASLLTAAISAVVYWYRQDSFVDEVRPGFGCILITFGTLGSVIGAGIATLPTRFFQSEKAGRNLVKLVGVKSPTAIRVVASGIALVSTLFIVIGGYWLLLE
ncbi:hypothetical protein CA51_31680 [Rosistilla oblonga]|uniref:hypothetical protein n=1 Tax=Rosistilla oblonga TaxID=2527990 RepID=UPI00118C5897|nr:hypothetical protein [Rosistilla oblonga]QDV13280.1 hypothetical protein CA51_31680 [Rosistilla oblonga]